MFCDFRLLISMAPLGSDACAFRQSVVPLVGAPVVEGNSSWFRLFLYEQLGRGVPSLLLPMGTRLKTLPKALADAKRLIVAASNHEPNIVLADSVLSVINEALLNSAVFVQVSDWREIITPVSWPGLQRRGG